jgi:hypothetical protein
LTGLRAGRARSPARAGRRDRTTGTTARAPTSSHPAQAGVTGIDRRAATVARAEKADRRAVAHHRSVALARRGKDRRKAPAARAGRHANREAGLCSP